MHPQRENGWNDSTDLFLHLSGQEVPSYVVTEPMCEKAMDIKELS